MDFCAVFYYYTRDDFRLIKEGKSMSLDGKIDTLKSKHQALENAIEDHNNRPHPDDIEIASLKKQKLKIKDEIAAIADS